MPLRVVVQLGLGGGLVPEAPGRSWWSATAATTTATTGAGSRWIALLVRIVRMIAGGVVATLLLLLLLLDQLLLPVLLLVLNGLLHALYLGGKRGLKQRERERDPLGIAQNTKTRRSRVVSPVRSRFSHHPRSSARRDLKCTLIKSSSMSGPLFAGYGLVAGLCR